MTDRTGATERRAAFWQLVRYGIIGVISTGIYAIVYWIVVRELGRPPQLGNILGYIVAVAAGYPLHSKISFRAHGTRDRKTQLRFVIASLLSYLLNAFWTWLCTAALDLPTWTPLLPISIATPIIMFAVNRLWVFR